MIWLYVLFVSSVGLFLHSRSVKKITKNPEQWQKTSGMMYKSTVWIVYPIYILAFLSCIRDMPSWFACLKTSFSSISVFFYNFLKVFKMQGFCIPKGSYTGKLLALGLIAIFKSEFAIILTTINIDLLIYNYFENGTLNYFKVVEPFVQFLLSGVPEAIQILYSFLMFFVPLYTSYSKLHSLEWSEIFDF